MEQRKGERFLIRACMGFIFFISIYILFAILNDIKRHEQCDALGGVYIKNQCIESSIIKLP